MNTSGAADIGSQERVTEEMSVQTAFVVMHTHQGFVIAADDPSLLADRVKTARRPTADEVDAMCAAVRTDLAAQKVAAQVHHGMMAMAKAAQDQMLTNQVMQNIRMPGQ